jgi:hypothetical protein
VDPADLLFLHSTLAATIRDQQHVIERLQQENTQLRDELRRFTDADEEPDHAP